MRCVHLVVTLVLFILPALSHAQPLNASCGDGGTQLADASVDLNTLRLAPGYVTSDGGIAYLTQVDDMVYWFAEHPGRSYSHVFRGRRNGSTINGRFISVPKYTATTTGRVRMAVAAGGTLIRQGSDSDLPFAIMRPCKLSTLRTQLPPQTDGGFRSHGADFDGSYQDDDGRRFYVRTVDSKVVFFAESQFDPGRRPKAAYIYFGDQIEAAPRFSSGPMIAMPKGERRASGSFNMGFGDPKSLSGQSTFQHFENLLAIPIAQQMPVRLIGEAEARMRNVRIDADRLVIEGDIVVGELQTPGPNSVSADYALAVSNENSHWPSCRVPYEIDRNDLVVRPGDSNVTFTTGAARTLADAKIQTLAAIENAIVYVNENTRFTWVPRNSDDKNYVVFEGIEAPCGFRGDDRNQPVFCGRSRVGRAGGSQDISYTVPSNQARGRISQGTFIHEMGHAMGLFHEHTRSDRDDSVRINWNGIRAGSEANFERRTSNGLEIGPYDFRSQMHYAANTSGILVNGVATQTVIPRDETQSIGPLRSEFSDGDLEALRVLCPTVLTETAQSRRSDGAGIAVTNVDEDTQMEVVLMDYKANREQSGLPLDDSRFNLKLCEYDVFSNALDCRQDLELQGMDGRSDGADVAFGDLDGFQGDDMLIASYTENAEVVYRICFNFTRDRLGNCLSRRVAMAGRNFGSNVRGLGIAIADIDGTGHDDVVIGVYNQRPGLNQIEYMVGLNPTSLGYFNWLGPFEEEGTTYTSNGFGAAMFDSDNNGRPELMFMMLNGVDGPDNFETSTFYNLNASGVSDGTRLDQIFQAQSSQSQGAGIAAFQFGDGEPSTSSASDGAPDLFLMSLDDGGNGHLSGNSYRLRLVFSGAQ